MSTKKIARAGIIDIGSKSLRLLIGEKTDKGLTVLESLKNVLPLGKDVFYKERISQETINATIHILQKYRLALQEYDVKNLKIFATTAVREARNREVFLDAVLRNTGFPVEVFTVGDIIYYIDSYLHYKLKGKYPIHEKNVLIVELGAGSTDIAILEKGYMINNTGIPLGSLRLKNVMSKLEGDPQEIRDTLTEYIVNELNYIKRLIGPIPIDDIILIIEDFSAGFSKLLKDPNEFESFTPLSLKQAQTILSNCERKSPEELVHLYGVNQDTAETLEVTAFTIRAFYSLIPKDTLYIFQASLSEAVLTNLVAVKDVAQTYKEFKHLIYIARYLCRRYNADIEHAKAVTSIARKLFVDLHHILGLRKTDVVYLILAAYLHDIGMFISNRAHHKHTDYIIRSLNLFRVKEEEIRLIAQIARYHRKSQRYDADPSYQALPADMKLLVLKLSALLRIANALDRSHKQKIGKVIVQTTKSNEIVLQVAVNGNAGLERWAFEDKKDLFEEISGSKLILKLEPNE